MIKSIKFYTRMLLKLLRRDIISKEDYMREYDKVSATYNLWLNAMGRYTDRIIKPELLNSSKNILDLACGTGYISSKLYENDKNSHITAVDISSDMLSGIDKVVREKIKMVNSDGINYLKSTVEIYDAIYCGWALPYFDHDELIKLMYNRVNNQGVVSIISNSKGTLSGIENIFLNVMKDNQSEIDRPMEIASNLPRDKKELRRWFEKYGFETLELGEDEVEFAFDRPLDLHEWITKTGAIAGTKKIFKDYEVVLEDVLKEIEKKKYREGKYVINHKFVYGIFRKR